MKVRQDPPAHPGYNGKQGGERFRTILKYPTATDMAMKRYRANDERMIAGVKAMYPAGTKIVLDSMGDDPRPIPPGTKGTVVHVDDIGTVHCNFENGRRLGLVPGEDHFHKYVERTRDEAR